MLIDQLRAGRQIKKTTRGEKEKKKRRGDTANRRRDSRSTGARRAHSQKTVTCQERARGEKKERQRETKKLERGTDWREEAGTTGERKDYRVCLDDDDGLNSWW